MKFASFPVFLLAALTTYQWPSFGAYGATIEAASSPDLEAETEEISLPLNALRGNRNLASGVRYFRFKHKDSGRYIMPSKSACNNGTPLVFASRPASDLALVWYQDSNGNIHSLICGDSLTVTVTDVGTNKCANNGKLLLRPVKDNKDHQLMDAKSISNRVESKGCSKWLYGSSKAVWVKVDNNVRIAKYYSSKSAQNFAIEDMGTSVKRTISGVVKDGHYQGGAIRDVTVKCYEIDSEYWHGDVDRQLIGTATTNSAGKFEITMNLSKNSNIINIRDDFGEWQKRGLDLFCKANKSGWKEMYTATRVDNDGSWNLGTINMFATRPAKELATSNGCNVVKDFYITADAAEFFKPSCDYHDACWGFAGDYYETASECNEEFRQLMKSQCNKAIADNGYLYPGAFTDSEYCHEAADIMAAAVDASAPYKCGTCCDQTIQKKRNPFSEWSSIEENYKDGGDCSIKTLFESCNSDSDCNGSEECLKGYCSDGMNGSSCASSGDCKQSRTIRRFILPDYEIKAVCTSNKCDWP